MIDIGPALGASSPRAFFYLQQKVFAAVEMPFVFAGGGSIKDVRVNAVTNGAAFFITTTASETGTAECFENRLRNHFGKCGRFCKAAELLGRHAYVLGVRSDDGKAVVGKLAAGFCRERNVIQLAAEFYGNDLNGRCRTETVGARICRKDNIAESLAGFCFVFDKFKPSRLADERRCLVFYE